MKTVSGPLLTLINNTISGAADGSGIPTQMAEADLYTIVLSNSAGTLRFTSADFDIAFGGNTWLSSGVRIDQRQSKTQGHWKIGLDVDQWVVTLMPRSADLVTLATFPDLINSNPFLAAANSGALDSADFQVDRAYFSTMPTWPIAAGGAVPVGTITIFAGMVMEVDTTEQVCVITANDYRDLLSMSMPRHFFQSQCRFTLYADGCNIAAAGFAKTATVSSLSGSSIVLSGLAAPGGSGTYKQGRIVITSGNNNTFYRSITDWDLNQTITPIVPFPFAFSFGVDTCTLYPGCDKTFATCGNFGNQVNFGGQIEIPIPETAS